MARRRAPRTLTRPSDERLPRSASTRRALAAITLNFDEWGRYLLWQLRRLVSSSGDHRVGGARGGGHRLPQRRRAARRVAPVAEDDEPQLLVPCRLTVGGVELSLFTTLTTFGTPRDITLDELAVELFFPADDATEAILRGR